MYGANPVSEFVFELGDTVAQRFAQVLTICDRHGLTGARDVASDGVKLSLRNPFCCAERKNFTTLQNSTEPRKHVGVARDNRSD